MGPRWPKLRTSLRLAAFVLAIGVLTSARPALAVCGDSIIDVGEDCDIVRRLLLGHRVGHDLPRERRERRRLRALQLDSDEQRLEALLQVTAPEVRQLPL